MLKSDRAKIYGLDLKDKLYNRNRRKICVFMGAGASLSSGSLDFEKLKKKISENLGFNIEENDIHVYFDKLFSRIKQPLKRAILLKEFLNVDSPPSEGYIYMVILTRLGIIDFVITTNFDFFLEKADKIVSKAENTYNVYIPYMLDKNIDINTLDSEKIPFFKIHGDWNSGIYYITQRELNTGCYPDSIKNVLYKIFTNCDIIFIGYGGHEKKLAKTLMPIARQLHNICWFNPQPPNKSKELYSVIKNNLIYENIPTDTTNLYFDNVLREITLTVIEGYNNLANKIKANYLTIDIIETQINLWNIDNLNLKINNSKNTFNISHIFVKRENIEIELEKFFNSDKTVFILAGKSGFGKTTLLKTLSYELNEVNRLFLFIPAKIIPKTLMSYDDVISQCLGMGKIDLSLLNHELTKKNKYIFIVLDGINEFSPEYIDCEELYKKVHEYARKLRAKNANRVKIIISSRNETWAQLQERLYEMLESDIYYNEGKAIVIEQFSENEFKLAYQKYQLVYNIKTTYEMLLPLAKERLMDPFMLNLTCEAQQSDIITFETPSLNVHNQFFHKKFKLNFNGDIQTPNNFLTVFANKCFEKKTTKLLSFDLPDVNDKNLLRHLIDLNILEEHLKEDVYYSWTHDRFFEFFLSKALRNLKIDNEEDMKIIFDKIKEFSNLYGAIKFILFSRKDIMLFVSLLNSNNKELVSLLKDMLFEISQSDISTFKSIFDSYINSSYSVNGLRLLLQAASLNSALKGLIYEFIKIDNPIIQSEGNYFFIMMTTREINTQSFLLTKGNIEKALNIEPQKSGWLNISTLISLISNLSWDNFRFDLKNYYQVIRELLFDNLLKISRENINELSIAIKNFTNKYFFNAENIDKFFIRLANEKSEFQVLIDEIKYDDNDITDCLNLINKYLHSTHKVERMIVKISVILAGRRNPQATQIYLWELLRRSISPDEGDFCSGSAAYLVAANGTYDSSFIFKMNDFILGERPDLLEYETDYETLFNPIGTYGFIFPIKNKGLPIDLFSKYIELFVKNNNSNALLKILHALRQAIALFPMEGLKTIKPLLEYKGNSIVRERMIMVLAESFARNPEITNIFIAQNELSFSIEERYKIKFGVDPKIYAHAITILEWGRIYNFFFSTSNSRSYTHKILTIINKSKDLNQAITEIINIIREI